MALDWILKYYPPCTACFGPSDVWYFLGVPLEFYPYLILVALVGSPVIYLTYHTVMVLLGKRKIERGWVLKKNIKKVALVFLILMIIQIVFVNWWMSGAIY